LAQQTLKKLEEQKRIGAKDLEALQTGLKKAIEYIPIWVLADNFGLPVSTTDVLTSGIAGTMFANRSGLQKSTLRNIVLASVLTLPVCFFLGATIFAAMLYLFFNILGWK
jgi:PiT family inorganic phosphate transporter